MEKMEEGMEGGREREGAKRVNDVGMERRGKGRKERWIMGR